MRFGRGRGGRPAAGLPEERQDEPLALAELYAALLARSGDAGTLDRLSGPERSFLLGQRCEVALRGGGFAAVAADPAAEGMAAALRELGAVETAGLLDAALDARHEQPAEFDARCRGLDAHWAGCEGEIGRFSAAWARNHGMMQ